MRTIGVVLALLTGCGPGGADAPADPLEAPVCETAVRQVRPPRQLRLLTRREYDATMADLLPDAIGAGSTCAVDADCDWVDESCDAGTCTADPCEVVTFAYPGGPFGSVVVAGSFNGWASTVAAGGWEAVWDPALGAHVTKRAVPDGDHAYKFVVDGQWLADPSNPSTVSDGYGGSNSALHQACAGAPVSAAGAPSDGFPVESRPQHYPFDNAAATGLVTSVHVERYGLAAERLAETAVSDLTGLLGCDPAVDGDEACIGAWVSRFGRRAWRRPLTGGEIDQLVGLALAEDDRQTGVSVALQVMLQSPYFLYRSEVGTEVAPGEYQLDGFEIASALSYFLWGTTPDDALLDAAAAGALDTAEGRRVEAERLLADPRARTQLATFATQWLGLEELPDAVRSTALYPEWDAALGRAMVDETRAFVTWVAFDGPGRFSDLLLSDTTFVDPALAELYGLSGSGEVTLPPERVGLLGQAGVLAAYAHSDQSSPIKRGVMVRERMLCQLFPTPPANAGTLPDVDPNATTRERFEAHSSDPACAGCHRLIDPIGFGLEGFDAVGAYRTTENGLTIDSTGVITDLDGPTDPATHPFSTQPQLAGILAGSDTARRCFATQVYRFATGGLDTDAQTCAIGAIDQQFAATGGDLVGLLADLTSSVDFVRRSP